MLLITIIGCLVAVFAPVRIRAVQAERAKDEPTVEYYKDDTEPVPVVYYYTLLPSGHLLNVHNNKGERR